MSGPRVLRLRGEVDVAVVDRLRASWYLVAEQDDPEVVVIDLSEVTFMDASALGLLVGVWNRQHRHGGEVVLRGVPPQVRSLLQLTGVLDAFSLQDPPDGHLDGSERHCVLDLRDGDGDGAGSPSRASRAAGPGAGYT